MKSKLTLGESSRKSLSRIEQPTLRKVDRIKKTVLSNPNQEAAAKELGQIKHLATAPKTKL
jgi:hypothetical protein